MGDGIRKNFFSGKNVGDVGKWTSGKAVIVLGTQQTKPKRRETMETRTGTRKETYWSRIFIVAFLVIGVAFAFSVNTLAQDIPIDVKVKDKDGKEITIKIKLDEKYQLKEAKVGGKDNTVSISATQNLPIELHEGTRMLYQIRPGSVVVFEGSSYCIPIPDGRGGVIWIGYPPGTRCP
jgi:hypothetical protein